MTDYLPLSSTLTPDRVLGLLWNRWRLLVKFIATFAVTGVVYALLSPEEYTSGASLMPEFQSGSAANLKRFSALADLAGINIEGATTAEAVRPDLYPDILSSTPFLLAMLNQPVKTRAGKTYASLTAYLTATTPNSLVAWLTDKPLTMPQADSAGHPMRLNREQEDFLKDFRKRIDTELDNQSGLILLQVKMPDAEVAAQICQQAITYLTRYVVQYRTGKSRKELLFLTRQLSDARIRYDRALRALSAYADQNQFLYTQSARIEGKRLEEEHTLAQHLYDDLSRQYERSRLKIQEETPILSVLEPPKVSARRSEPRRTLTVLIFAGLGLAAGALLTLAKAVMSGLYLDHKPQTTNR